MRYLAYIGASLFAACLLVLINMSDIDELGLRAQAVQEQADRLQMFVDPDGAYIPYTQRPTGGGYVSSRL